MSIDYYDLVTSIVSEEDFKFMEDALCCGWRDPDFVIAPEGEPYLLRWHIIPRNEKANVYMHLMLKGDAGREFHDHPWRSFSVVIGGGYEESIEDYEYDYICKEYIDTTTVNKQTAGCTWFREASESHRLDMTKDHKYALTIFSTGPKVREWGFSTDEGWVHWEDYVNNKEGVSERK